jgi:hypothetical protein
MDGEGPDTTHNGVRGDVVDCYPGLFGITVAEQGRGESSNYDVLAPIDSDELSELSSSCRSWSVR